LIDLDRKIIPDLFEAYRLHGTINQNKKMGFEMDSNGQVAENASNAFIALSGRRA
jgi:hypothetical protein